MILRVAGKLPRLSCPSTYRSRHRYPRRRLRGAVSPLRIFATPPWLHKCATNTGEQLFGSQAPNEFPLDIHAGWFNSPVTTAIMDPYISTDACIVSSRQYNTLEFI